ncbi:MAG: Ig-like domain-containing protein [Thermomicrobiaceae bacterium]|nr:Ig-like domain-containing protein [Thermomicrobiaceae bacterium]
MRRRMLALAVVAALVAALGIQVTWAAGGTVTLTPQTPTTLPAGITFQMRIEVKDDTGTPIAKARIVAVVTGANPKTYPGQTNLRGRSDFSYVGRNVGTDAIHVYYDVNSDEVQQDDEPSADITVTWTEAQPKSIVIDPTSASLVKGQTAAFHVTITNTLDQPVANASVVWVAQRDSTTVRSGGATTDESGIATFQYVGTSAGSDKVTAFYDANGNGAQDSGELTTETATVTWSLVPAGALQPAQEKAGCTFYQQTRHNLCGGFRSYWQQFGGLAVYGYPLTEEYRDPVSGLVTQWFERARFEWHPGSWPARYDVLLGRLGNEVAAQLSLTGTAPFQQASQINSSSCTYFPQTHHNLCGGFRSYWQQFGGLAVYGMPISEEYRDPSTGLTVQYFERQRFEWHPGSWPARYDVLLGRLGAQELGVR